MDKPTISEMKSRLKTRYKVLLFFVHKILPILIIILSITSIAMVSVVVSDNFTVSEDEYNNSDIMEQYRLCNDYSDDDRRLDCFREYRIENLHDENEETVRQLIYDVKLNKALGSAIVLAIIFNVFISLFLITYAIDYKTSRDDLGEWYYNSIVYCVNCGEEVHEN